MPGGLSAAAIRAQRSLQDCGVIRIRRATQEPFAELVRAKIAQVIRRDPDNKWADIALRNHHRSTSPRCEPAAVSKPPAAGEFPVVSR
jgi:hypothetical protein